HTPTKSSTCTLFPYTTLFRSLAEEYMQLRKISAYTSPKNLKCQENLVAVSAGQSAMHANWAGRLSFIPPMQNYHLQLSRQFANEDRKSTRLNSSHVKISYAVL